MKKLIIIPIILFQIITYAQFSGGSGTVLDPYQVETAEDLDNIRNYLESSFIQTANIDLGVAPWNEGEGWNPIGDYNPFDSTKSFRGNYDGNDFEIKNMFINRPEESDLGLFGSSLDCIFTNINLNNINITGQGSIGGIVAISYNDIVTDCTVEGIIEGFGGLGLLMYFFEGYYIENCHVKGEIISTGGTMIGGMGGIYQAQSIKNCTSEVTITSNGRFVAGLMAETIDIELIKNCSASVNISSNDDFIGGLFSINVQVNKNTVVENCFTIGSIQSTGNNVGGFIAQIGLLDQSPEFVLIKNCYSSVNVEGNDLVAGFVSEYTGGIPDSTEIKNCYSYGAVNGNSNVGGFIGYIDSISIPFVYNSYWNTETSTQAYSAAGEGRVTSEMIFPYTDNTYMDWDFINIWQDDEKIINNGYPIFNWTTGIMNNEQLTINNNELEQNYPNPFNNETNIDYVLDNIGNVEINIYNSNGQFIQNLVNGVVNKGIHSATFKAINLNSGVYYYNLKIDGFLINNKKMLYLK
ncbi:MAG: T9SS type A sorting domain-containing protein [Candidatus Delongbacteria bacterium]|nr:T9SS type A sorting domain-containing protein [Candidatus Delongbacteria bacterium]